MQNMEKYNDKITKGNRTYFFDIKESQYGSLYLKISESKRTEKGFERYRLLVFEEDIEHFAKAFQKMLYNLKKLQEPQLTDKAYSVEKIRETHKQAYLPWTQEDDNKLELLFCEGKKVKELSQIFGRKEGAIDSRIKKLELKDKYGR